MEGPIVLDQRALSQVSDIALQLFLSRPEYNHQEVMYQALEEWLIRKGITPCFTVKTGGQK